ncbi:MAG: site-specific integrase [Opitutus sp.]
MESYTAFLENQGYKPSTVYRHLWLIGGLNQKLLRSHRGAHDIDERLISRFLEQRSRESRASGGAQRAMRWFVELLRAANVGMGAPSAPKEETNAHVLNPFRHYLLIERGLAPGTVRRYVFGVRKFLLHCFGEDRCQASALKPSEIIEYVRQVAPRVAPGGITNVLCELRAFLRFLHYSGHLKRDLSPAVPTAPSWRGTELPKYLPQEAVQKVLDACNQETPLGRRNYAMILLLARLGLRGGEVLRLTLDDIDWDHGLITLRSTKNGRDARLPLPADVGKAMARYLRQDRPHGQSRLVFLKVKAPQGGFSKTAVFSTLVRRTLERAGVQSARKGTHLFRHSLATSMLGQGASLQEIGQVLRHKSPRMTAIYAKVELNALRAIALPWPGGVK